MVVRSHGTVVIKAGSWSTSVPLGLDQIERSDRVYVRGRATAELSLSLLIVHRLGDATRMEMTEEVVVEYVVVGV